MADDADAADYVDPAVPLPAWLDPYRVVAAGLAAAVVMVVGRVLA